MSAREERHPSQTFVVLRLGARKHRGTEHTEKNCGVSSLWSPCLCVPQLKVGSLRLSQVGFDVDPGSLLKRIKDRIGNRLSRGAVIETRHRIAAFDDG